MKYTFHGTPYFTVFRSKCIAKMHRIEGFRWFAGPSPFRFTPPQKNNVLLKTQKSEFSRQTDQESGPRTSGAKPVWAKITFL